MSLSSGPPLPYGQEGPTSRRTADAGHFVRRWGVPAFVLAVSLAITGLAAGYVYSTSKAAEQKRFENLVGDARDEATNNLGRYLAALRGFAGLYAADDRVDRESFEAYAATLGIRDHYRGLRGIGFAERVTPDGRDRFLAVARSETRADEPAFRIRDSSESSTGAASAPVATPAPRTTDAMVVRYAALAGSGPPAVPGFDMASDPARLAAMRRACEADEPVVTPRLFLARTPDGVRHPGFIIYLPVFRGLPSPDADARRTALRGYVFASFRSDDLFRQIVNGNANARLRLRVYEGQGAGGGPVVYDSAPAVAGTTPARPRFTDSFTLKVAGGSWTMAVAEAPAFYMESNGSAVPLILLCGGAISLVLFAVTRGQVVARADAERAAAVSQQAQRALAASQSRLRRLVDANLIGVFFCGLDGEVSGGNDEFFRLLGQDRGGDGRPLRLADITVDSSRAGVEQALRQIGRDGACPAFETALIRPGRPPVPVLLGLASVSTTADAAPVPNAEAVAFALDLTDRYRAEHELRQAKEAAEQAREAAERANRSKDQFLAMLSHELRTPLTPVLAATAGAAGNAALPAGVRDDLVMIHRNVELEARLIDDLLDLTRVGRGKLQLRTETVDVHRVLVDALGVVPPEDVVGRGLRVERHLSAAAHHVSGDAARLQQVFWNLIKNAVKFTPDGGEITLRTGNGAGPVDGGSLPELWVEVTDTGRGIEAEILPKLFDAFEQGSAARAQASGGLGLGLAISRGLVEAHGGRITADSGGTGRGATFRVQLATVPAPAVDEAPAVPAAAAEPGDGFRLLLVEDHVDTARVLARLLTRAGHAVSVAHTVAEGLAACDGAGFDLLVSDLGLPDGSGTDVVRGFRRRYGHGGSDGRPVGAIALTGFGAEDDVSRTRTAGFDAHLTKPVAFDLLTATIRRVMTTPAA